MSGPSNPKIISATVSVGVYGSFRPHSGVPRDVGGRDVFSVFAARSVSLGWASTGMNDMLSGATAWGMNDAKQVWSPHDDTALVAWFQVGLPSETGGVYALPVQPILACAEDTVNWFGVLSLTGMQVLLPVQIAGNAQGHLASGLMLFVDRGPDTAVPIKISLDGGSDDIRPAADKIFAGLRGFRAAPFSFDSYSVEKQDAVRLEPAVVSDIWMGGETRNPVTFFGTAPEPGFVMMGWVLELCAEACRLAGIKTTVMASITQGT